MPTMKYSQTFKSDHLDVYVLESRWHLNSPPNATPQQRNRGDFRKLMWIEVVKSKFDQEYQLDTKYITKQKKLNKVGVRLDYFEVLDDFYDPNGNLLFTKGDLIFKPAGGNGRICTLLPVKDQDKQEVFMRWDTSAIYQSLSFEELDFITQTLHQINNNYKNL